MRLATAAFVALTLLLPLGACQDTSGVQPGILTTDTLKLAAPTVDSTRLPSALDFTTINNGRYPERISDAGLWDLGLRLSGGQLYLRPAPSSPSRNGAGVIGPTSDVFDKVKTVPSQSKYGDTLVVVQEGKTYLVRSRQGVSAYGTSCYYYGKLQPVQVTVAAGTARFAMVVNSTCNDRRVTEN